MIRVRHVGVTVDDLDKMLSFYSTILGFSEHKISLEQGEYIDNFSSLKGVQVTTAKLSNGHSEVLVELLKYHSHKGTYNRSELINRGITHFALTVDNLRLLYEECSKAGIKFNSPPQASPDGKALVTFCRDPEDNLLELVEMVK